jgi:hypothetical protein
MRRVDGFVDGGGIHRLAVTYSAKSFDIEYRGMKRCCEDPSG